MHLSFEEAMAHVSTKLSGTTIVSTSFPIHQLPHEILANVFVCGVLDEVDADSKRMTGALWKYQVLVGSVCKLWRDVSHTTPQFWSSCIAIASANKEVALFHEKMLSLAIRRAGQVPVEVLLIIGGYGRLLMSESLVSNARDLVRGASKVTIVLQSPGDFDTARAFLPLPASPRLKTYTLLDRRFAAPASQRLSLFSASLPPIPLTGLNIASPHFVVDLALIDTSQLKTLSISAFDTVKDTVSSISSCPQLLQLCIPIAITTSSNLLSDSLTTLNIDLRAPYINRYHVDWKSIAGTLEGDPLMILGGLPSLQHLKLTWYGSNAPKNVTFDCPFLYGLKSLCLDGASSWGVAPVMSVGAILERTPNLLALEVRDELARELCDITQSLIQEHTQKTKHTAEGEPSWHSSLRYLRFVGGSGVPIGSLSAPGWKEIKQAQDFTMNCKTLVEMMPQVEIEWYLLPWVTWPKVYLPARVIMGHRFKITETSISGTRPLFEGAQWLFTQ